MFTGQIDLGNVLTILALVGALWRFTNTQQKSQAVRDQKIDIVLFGVEGKPGLVGDVEDLKADSSYALEGLRKLGFDRRKDERRHVHS